VVVIIDGGVREALDLSAFIEDFNCALVTRYITRHTLGIVDFKIARHLAITGGRCGWQIKQPY
jgi:hypothetical protein